MAIRPMKPIGQQTAVERMRDAERRRARRAAERRTLTREEVNLVPGGLRNKIAIDKVTLISRAHNPFASGKILTRNDDIYWPDCPEDFTAESIERQALLVHELCHVWQYRHGHLSLWSYISRPGNWKYTYTFVEGKAFTDYRVEEMADIAQDWYLELNNVDAKNHAPGTDKPTKQQLIDLVPFSK